MFCFCLPVASMDHEELVETEYSEESNMTVKFFDVDLTGLMYEKENESLLKEPQRMRRNGLYPLYHASGTFVGDDNATESLERISSDAIKTYKSADEFMPFLLGISNGELTSPQNSVKDHSNSSKTKPIFDDSGIYIGEEDDLMTPDDSIETNLAYEVPATLLPVYIHEHKYFHTSSEPLKPIREEKSHEILDSKSINAINISIEKATTVKAIESSNIFRTQSVNSYNLHEHSRYRSKSLNNGPVKRFEPNEMNGTVMRNRATINAQRRIRSDSYPLALFIPGLF